MISKEYLQDMFWYDANTGLLHNKSSRRGAGFGNVAGSRSHPGRRDPYLRVKVDNRRYYAHRLVWIYHHGVIPKGKFIDHINGNALDNRIENLRCVTHRENCVNKQFACNTESGVVGVYAPRNSGKWTAAITIHGTRINLGKFGTKDAAVKARRRAERRFGFHPNHGKKQVEYKIPNIENDNDDCQNVNCASPFYRVLN